ncbi:aminotransferase class I/II-fold pyridoxal phosphate-dependent enzyme [Agrococcus sp. SL85]|uniref:MalY/PatB family protein n=1 Tax=Agrococcus sp. SL85 TaxID=2995141 RepID=UPI00226C7980|nr:aminotransferase class I/II-fold pyridoxal phosphate-dependent enzyme [Agrococcus sp. SL85]WAC66005.1 aminotransferase class I/II-fold pyridoxal phosphate-dependent enzyme [Agrococcus sp. SL85]
MADRCREQHAFDAIRRDDLERPSSRKWSLHPGTIGAWVAEMDFGTAPAVREALQRAVVDDVLGYLSPATAADLAEATALHQAREHGWAIDPERVHAVSDVMAALGVAVEEYTPEGSAVIVPTPAYMPFLTYLERLGRPVVQVPGVVVGGRWQHDLDGIDRAFAAGARTLVLCNPHNPTGTVLPREELRAISEIVERHGGRVFADEIHAAIRYDGRAHVPYASVSAAAAGHAITGTSASKAWNIPGLKAAQLITSNEADEAVYRRFGFAVVHGASTLGVIASAAAYRDGGHWLAGTVRYLQGNRDLLASLLAARLPQVAWRPPEATYLAWLDLAALGIDGSPAELLRERAGVTLTDGALCGAGSERHVRLVFATPAPVLAEAVDRLADALAPAGAAR